MNHDSVELTTRSVEETLALGERLANLLGAQDVVFLIGELGAGKTVLAKGIANGLGVAHRDDVLSPSFTLMRSYRGARELHHLDLYRIRRPEDAAEIVAMAPEGVLLIEWPERGVGYVPEPQWIVELRIEDGSRRITITGPAASVRDLHA